ncbi:DNA polymerase III subunit psi [Testudinibacter sp. P80/BLE/0925]|uniref:DNA polymerase III subunit psi n=1 Tax=Testudinibacter sp. TW-1 TaxID=3417757 RepID=UPI003D36E7BE
MPARRARLLQQMGIDQWTLRRPQALKGAAAIAVAENIKLLLVSEQSPADSLLADLYRALGIRAAQCLIINSEQLNRLKITHSPALWLVGETPELSGQTQTALQALPHIQTDDWQTLLQNPQAKRRLWQQLQQFQLQDDGS